METTKNGHVAVRFVDGGEYRITVVPVDLEFRTESSIGHSLYRLHLRVVTDDSDGFQGQKVQVSFWDKGDHERVEFIRALIGRRCHAEFHGELFRKYRNYWLDEIAPLDGEEAERIAAAVPERLAQSDDLCLHKVVELAEPTWGEALYASAAVGSRTEAWSAPARDGGLGGRRGRWRRSENRI